MQAMRTELQTLEQWLQWIEEQHPEEIELGLERVRLLAEAMSLVRWSIPVVVVAGTNGKGTTVRAFEQLALTHRLNVASFTSPHFFHYGERVKINGSPVSDARLIEGFAAVAAMAHRLSVELTYFEYSTLCALYCFKQQAELDVLVLEVGLGGRLDAVNIVDNTLGIITSIGLDHCDWLGDSLEAIGFEKAGIARTGVPLVLAEGNMPKSVHEQATTLGAHVCSVGDAYDWHIDQQNQTWCLTVGDQQIGPVPLMPNLVASNLAAATYAFNWLFSAQLDVSAVCSSLSSLEVFGRFTCIATEPMVYLDVAHNPPACQQLSRRLMTMETTGKTVAVCSMLKDKDAASALACLSDVIDHWYYAPLDNARAMTGAELERAMPSSRASGFESLHEALKSALEHTTDKDRLVILGSFYTVSLAYTFLQSTINKPGYGNSIET